MGKLQRRNAKGKLPEELALTYLEWGVPLCNYEVPADFGLALWKQHREAIIAHYVANLENERGSRPWAMWEFEFKAYREEHKDRYPRCDFRLADLLKCGIKLTPEEAKLVEAGP